MDAEDDDRSTACREGCKIFNSVGPRHKPRCPDSCPEHPFWCMWQNRVGEALLKCFPNGDMAFDFYDGGWNCFSLCEVILCFVTADERETIWQRHLS